MKKITIRINKDVVYREVEKATDYAAVKMPSNPEAPQSEEDREKIVASEEELTDLSRFWDDAANTAADKLRFVLVGERNRIDYYELALEVSNGFNLALLPAMERSLISYFVNSILARWYMFTLKTEAPDALTLALSALDSVERMLGARRYPVRRKCMPF